jgi:hypothetical protein
MIRLVTLLIVYGAVEANLQLGSSDGAPGPAAPS